MLSASNNIAPNRQAFRKQAGAIIAAFIVSRILLHFAGVRFQYDALYQYWQYLDVWTLKNNLLKGVWYDHTQPPVFNLFLGLVLKIAPDYSGWIFAGFFKLITLSNALLLLSIVQKTTGHRWLPLVISLFYLLSPGTMVFENELFYTGLITFLFLVSVFYLLRLGSGISWKNAIGVFLPLTIICLTRSMYHVAFLFVIAAWLICRNRKQQQISRLYITATLSVLLVGGWYLKNKLIFGEFSASSWLGMNMARNIFHDSEFTDSSKIESIPPFSPISDYKRFISGELEAKYAGLNDRDLLQEWKNDSLRNEKHISYIEVSNQYKKAGIEHIKQKPLHFAKNVIQSAVTFFAPATRYTLMEDQARKIRYFDAVYSLNFSQFAAGKQQRRIALTISAIPQILLFLFAFWVTIKETMRRKTIPVLSVFIMLILLYAFGVSSLIEHYENMRFRFELTPLFLILLSTAIITFGGKKSPQGLITKRN